LPNAEIAIFFAVSAKKYPVFSTQPLELYKKLVLARTLQLQDQQMQK